MERQTRSIKAVLASMAKAGERSTLFWWFVEHHDEIARAATQQRIRWSILAAEVAELGLTNRLGKAATPKLAKLTWERAKRYVASEQQPARRADHRPSLRAMPSSPDAYPSMGALAQAQAELAPPTATLPALPSPTDVAARDAALGGWLTGRAEDALTPEEAARADRELGRMQEKFDDADRHLKL